MALSKLFACTHVIMLLTGLLTTRGAQCICLLLHDTCFKQTLWMYTFAGAVDRAADYEGGAKPEEEPFFEDASVIDFKGRKVASSIGESSPSKQRRLNRRSGSRTAHQKHRRVEVESINLWSAKRSRVC